MNEQSWVNDKCDRSDWPAGEWDGEPDKVQWKDEATGLDCLANRQSSGGHWCGYVGLPPGHRFHGKDYDDVKFDNEDDPYPNVHGGLTFSEECDEADAPCRGICHVAAPGEPEKLWWLGFDCAHSGDLSPGHIKHYGSMKFGMDGYERYRALNYVKNECKKLAAQLKGNP